MTPLKIVCGWCGKELGCKEGGDSDGEAHGICDDCLLHNFPHLYDKVKGGNYVRKRRDIYAQLPA